MRAIAAGATPQESEAHGYRMPPKAIADLIDAPPTPGVTLSLDRKWMLTSAKSSVYRGGRSAATMTN